LTRQLRIALACTAAVAALLTAAAPAGAGPNATASGEELVTFLTTGKLKVKNPISYQFICGATAPAGCIVDIEAVFVVKGPNVTVNSAGILSAQQIGIHEISTGKSFRRYLKDHLKSSKLRSTITATNTVTGEVDTDEQTFKFKK
jgi:hypothetical protein